MNLDTLLWPILNVHVPWNHGSLGILTKVSLILENILNRVSRCFRSRTAMDALPDGRSLNQPV